MKGRKRERERELVIRAGERRALVKKGTKERGRTVLWTADPGLLSR